MQVDRGTPITLSNGDKYIGSIDAGYRNGRGECTTADGLRKYAGEYRQGLREGRGVLSRTDPTGSSIYDGGWMLGYRHGDGVQTWPNGDRYIGAWSTGFPHGNGSYTWACPPGAAEFMGRPMVYVGQFQEGRRNGFGTMYYSDGSVYEGLWQDNNKVGDGTFIHADGCVTCGSFPLDNSRQLCKPSDHSPIGLSDFFLSPLRSAAILKTVQMFESRLHGLYNKFRHPPNGMSMWQFGEFCRSCGMADGEYGLADVNRVVCRSPRVQTEMDNPVNRGLHDIHAPDRRLLFRHFREGVVRVCLDRFTSLDRLDEILKLAEAQSICESPQVELSARELDKATDWFMQNSSQHSSVHDMTVTVSQIIVGIDGIPRSVLEAVLNRDRPVRDSAEVTLAQFIKIMAAVKSSQLT